MLPNIPESKRVLACVESAAVEYQQAAQLRPAMMEGPNARLHVYGDCEVGRQGIGGIGRVGKLEFGWIDRSRNLAIGLRRNRHSRGETAAAAVEDMGGLGNKAIGGNEDEWSVSPQLEGDDKLATALAVPEGVGRSVAQVESASNDMAQRVSESIGTSGSLPRLRKRRASLCYR